MLASLFWHLGAFLLGIILGGYIPSIHSSILSALAVVLALAFHRVWRLQIIFTIVACLCLGVWRTQGQEAPDKYLSNYFSQTQIWSVWVCADPEPDWDGQSTIVCPLPPSFRKETEGEKILIEMPLYPRFDYGDVLQVRCRLDKPAVFEDFDYASYLAARGIGATCSWSSDIEIRRAEAGKAWLRRLYQVKHGGLYLINRALPEPAAGLASALLLGYKHTLVQSEETNFQKAGLSHIVAISGGHISLLLELLIACAVYLGMNKRRAIWPALVIAGIYVLITGVQASAWRSLLMGAIMLYAWRRGKLQNAWSPLLLAGAYMLYWNPLLWRYDLGFQLSFLAIGGMIAFNPIMATKIYPYESSFGKFWQTIGSAFKLSLSAQIAVWPLLALTSGGVSLISPFTNVLAFWVFGPLVLSMLGALAASLICGINIFVWAPVYLLLEYLLQVGRFGANFPGGYIEVPWFNGWHAALYYLCLILFIIWKESKKRS